MSARRRTGHHALDVRGTGRWTVQCTATWDERFLVSISQLRVGIFGKEPRKWVVKCCKHHWFCMEILELKKGYMQHSHTRKSELGAWNDLKLFQRSFGWWTPFSPLGETRCLFFAPIWNVFDYPLSLCIYNIVHIQIYYHMWCQWWYQLHIFQSGLVVLSSRVSFQISMSIQAHWILLRAASVAELFPGDWPKDTVLKGLVVQCFQSKAQFGYFDAGRWQGRDRYPDILNMFHSCASV